MSFPHSCCETSLLASMRSRRLCASSANTKRTLQDIRDRCSSASSLRAVGAGGRLGVGEKGRVSPTHPILREKFLLRWKSSLILFSSSTTTILLLSTSRRGPQSSSFHGGLAAPLNLVVHQFHRTSSHKCERGTSDAIIMGDAIGKQAIDLEQVQVHPNFLVARSTPLSKIPFWISSFILYSELGKRGNVACIAVQVCSVGCSAQKRLQRSPQRRPPSS